MKQNCTFDSNKTFGSYVVTPQNSLLAGMAKLIARHPEKSGEYSSLFVYGKPGMGKTHLLHAIANELIKSRPTFVIQIVTGRDLMIEAIEAIDDNKLLDFHKKYSDKVDVLIIDDIHKLCNKAFTQNELLHIFKKLLSNNKQLVFASAVHPDKIKGLDAELRTILKWGIVADIKSPDLNSRTEIAIRNNYIS